MWKFLPFSFVIYCLEDIIINATGGLMVIFITVAIPNDSHQLLAKHPGGQIYQSMIHYL